MTREEQLDWLCRLRSEIYVYMPKEWLIPMNNALDMVIKELEQESTAKNDLGVDCISRADARKASIDHSINTGMVLTALSELPSVTPQEPKTGHWIRGKYKDDDIRYNDNSYKCDKCGKIVDFKENYCPNCGTRMVEPYGKEL